MKKTVFVFGALVIAVLTLLQLSTYTVTSGSLTVEIVIGIIAIIFFVFGVYWNQKHKKKTMGTKKKQFAKRNGLEGFSSSSC